MAFEVILMEAVSDDRVLVFLRMGGLGLFRVGDGSGAQLNAREPGGENCHYDEEHSYIFVPRVHWHQK
jgi:hypothetical protein